MKRVASILVCIVLLSSCLVPGAVAFEEQQSIEIEDISPKYEIISIITVSLNISTSGRADCGATVRVPSGYTVEVLAELQQNNSNGWETIHDWASSGCDRVAVSGPWYVMPGYSYRVKVTATTYDSYGNYVEAPVEYSDVKDY